MKPSDHLEKESREIGKNVKSLINQFKHQIILVAGISLTKMIITLNSSGDYASPRARRSFIEALPINGAVASVFDIYGCSSELYIDVNNGPSGGSVAYFS